MTTPAEARATAGAYVTATWPHCCIAEMLEDSADYFVRLQPRKGLGEPIGRSYLFVSKATGRVWTTVPMEVFDKIDGMTLVDRHSQA